MSFEDDVWDTLGNAFLEVSNIYKSKYNRAPEISELTAQIEIVLGANPDQYLNDGKKIRITEVNINVETRKGLHKLEVGDLIRARLRNGKWAYSRVFSVNNTNVSLGVYNYQGSHLNVDWRTMPFALREHNILETTLDAKNKWQFVEKIKITPDEAKPVPQRRISYCGIGGVLETLNYYFKLMDDPPTKHQIKNYFI